MKNYSSRIKERLKVIKELLQANPRGMTITDISDRIKINRNSVARYMDMLAVSGQVEVRQLGPAKVFYISQRVPISAMLNFSSDYILILDVNLKMLQVNENLLELLNAEAEDIVGRGMKDFPNPAFTNQEIFSRMREALNGKEIKFEMKSQVAEKEYYFTTTMLPTVFEDGSQGVTWILQDVTERKKAEKIIESLAKFPSENPNPVLRIAKDGRIMYANAAGSRLLSGWNRETGQIAPKEWQQTINGIFSSKESREVEAEHNGRRFSLIFVPVTGADYVNIYGRDVTERKKAS